MRQLLFATNNRGKLLEAAEEFRGSDWTLISPSDIAAGRNPIPEPEETGATYRENAKLKADAFFSWSGFPSFGDDAGLEVDALGGAPGLTSARYAGTKQFTAANIEKLLSAMNNVSERAARFRSLIYCCGFGPAPVVTEGVLEGSIALAPSGTGGFGYDCVFIPAGETQTLAALKEGGRRIATHRIQALRALVGALEKLQSAAK